MRKQKLQIPEPKKCWVNETQKVCYASLEEAEGAARLSEFEHGLAANSLTAYRCEFCGDWHLAHRAKR